ncbi:MAG: hypothetical protein LBV49_12260 [Azonexus sp.]|jgi:hypothetical protein|nr:hypothetical protein [Azonexus sp.]
MKQDISGLKEGLAAQFRDAMAEGMATGKATNPVSEAQAIAAYGQVDGVRRYREQQETIATGAKIQEVKTMPTAAMKDFLESSKPPPGDGFYDRQQNWNALYRAVNETVKARADDPVAFALDNQTYGMTPLGSVQNVQAVMAETQKRRAAMFNVSRDYGTPPALFSKQEAHAIGNYLATLQTPDKAGYLGQLAANGGADGVLSLSLQLKDKDMELATAANLAGQSSTMGRNNGQLYLEGKDLIAQKLIKIDKADETGIRAQINALLFDVYQTPQGRELAEEAAFGIYAKLAHEGKSGEAGIRQAVNLATGGIMKFNGGNLAKPYGWTDSAFQDAVNISLPQAITKAGGEFYMGGQKISAAELAIKLPGARLQTGGSPGTYLVMSGNVPVMRADGRPYILDVGRAPPVERKEGVAKPLEVITPWSTNDRPEREPGPLEIKWPWL